MSADPTCETCRYWDRRDDAGGLCCRYPPRVVMSSPGDAVTVFPDTRPFEWCGEHREAHPAPGRPTPILDLGDLRR